MKSTDLRSRISEVLKAQEAILKAAETEGRALNDEEAAEFDRLNETRSRLKADIDRLAAVEAARAEEREVVDVPETPVAATNEKDVEVRNVVDREATKPFATIGEQLFAVRASEMTGGRITDKRLLHIQEQESRAATGLGTQVPADGGFLVQQDLAAGIRERLTSTGAITSRVEQIPISAGSNGLKINALKDELRTSGNRYGGVSAAWADEAGTAAASKPTLRQIELSLKKLMAFVYQTEEALSDASALTAIVNRVVPAELSFRLEDAIINGTGSGQPLGILNSGAVVSVAAEGGQAADTIVPQNIFKMHARMFARSRANAVWLINQDIEPQLHSMVLTDGSVYGVPVYMPANGLADRPFATLMGRPVIPVEYCATLGDSGDIIFADLSQYVMIDKGGVSRASSIHVRFLNDEEVFRFTYRVDGAPVWDAPLTPANGTATLSPFITLAAR